MRIFNPPRAGYYALIIIIIAVLLISGCATEEKTWAEAKTEDTIESYKKYLVKHPKGIYANEAYEQIERLVWQKTDMADSIQGYENYLLEYPEGIYAESAMMRIEKKEWERATVKDIIFSYEDYILKYPQGSYVQEANKAILKHYLGFAVQYEGLSNAGLANGASYNPNEPGPHLIVIVDDNGIIHSLNNRLPANLVSSVASETVLIAVISEEWETIERCSYYGHIGSSAIGHIDRKQQILNVTVREAMSWKIIKTRSFKGSVPEKCSSLERFQTTVVGSARTVIPQTKINKGDAVSSAEVIKWLSNTINP